VPTRPKNEQRAERACGKSRTQRPNKITAPGVSWTKHENESALETETGTGTEANGGRHRACSWRCYQLERERTTVAENLVARRGNSSGESTLWTEENEIGRKSQTGALLTALVRPSLGTAQEIKNKTIF
jgi:hypothetical protein